MRQKLTRALGLGLVVAGLVVASSANGFPSTSVTWVPLTQSGIPIGDPANDANNERNIVGDVTNPAAFVGSDNDFLYFRIRLDADPRASDGVSLKPFGWSCAIETQGTVDTYEYLAAVNGIENNGPGGEVDQVEWRYNAVSAKTNDVSEEAEILVAAFKRSTNVEVVPATSTFSNNPDFFLDWAIPKATITAGGNGAPGIAAGTLLRFACGTSNNARNYGADPACGSKANSLCTLSDSFSDPFSCTVLGCAPQNGDMDGDGVSDAQELALGTNPQTKDSDGDGIPDNVELSPTGSTTGPYSAIDTDGDGVIDAKDSDSDNDCASDQTEGVNAYRNKSAAANASCPTGQVCDTTKGLCVPASQAQPCNGDFGSNATDACKEASKPACNTAAPFAGFCTECSATNVTKCSGATPTCDLTVGTCAPCNGDRGSGATRACADAANPFCDLVGGTCGKCAANPDCSATGHTGPTCDASTGACTDVDTDGDGVNDTVEGLLGTDKTKKDSDGDGIEDKAELTPIGGDTTGKVDTDGDGIIDALDTDSDGDGISDKDENAEADKDYDKDGKPNYRDPDDDGDGILTKDELEDTNKLPAATGGAKNDDVDGDGKKNWYDSDADGDSKADGTEGRGDDDKDGRPNYLDAENTPGPVGGQPFPDDELGVMEGGGFSCAQSLSTRTSSSGIAEFAIVALALGASMRRRRR